MPSTRRPGRARPAIRVRPVPRCDPPYDDEAEGAVWGVATTFPPATDTSRPAQAALQPAQNQLPAPSGAHLPAGTALLERPQAAGPPPVVAGPSAEARQAVRRFVAVLVEVLNGYRPPAHLRPLCRPVEAAEIIAHTRAAMHRIAEARRALTTSASRTGPRPTHPAPHRSADRHGRRPDPAAVVRLRLCEPRPGSVEATVLLVTAARTWALALRLDGGPDTWTASVARLL